MVVLSSAAPHGAVLAQELDLPVHRSLLERLPERDPRRSRRAAVIAPEQIRAAVGDGARGLVVDFSRLTRLIDGSQIDPAAIYGSVTIGPYPFCARETRFATRRFRRLCPISGGRGVLDVGYLLRPRINSEGWADRGQIAARFDLHLAHSGRDQDLGLYDLLFSFRRDHAGYHELAAITCGPFANRISSDRPGEVTISFTTDRALRCSVLVPTLGRVFSDAAPARHHEIRLRGLRVATTYRYAVRYGTMLSKDFELHTAPLPGEGELLFAFGGDSRQGVCAGTSKLMGVNHDILGRLAAIAYHSGAEFFIFGGDLISGYTAWPSIYRTQLDSFKLAMAGFWNERPVYPVPGNHEALLRVFEDGSRYGLSLDRWPYASASSEALFAQAFSNPFNGPQRSDRRRPSYRETAYSFRYGPVKFLAINNNYWFSSAPAKYGGCPEGYIMEDQLQWILTELAAAEDDPSVRHIFIYGQEPFFPNGGHAADAMWYRGDNRVRAHTWRAGELHASRRGILEVRNTLVRAFAASSKVAAVLGSDEHGYHRTLISAAVPVGDLSQDDVDGNGRIDLGRETVSPLGDLTRPLWYLVSGGAGAPYYSEELTPWNRWWKQRPIPRRGYLYSSQAHLLLIRSTARGCSLRVVNPFGEIVDEIPDLMASR